MQIPLGALSAAAMKPSVTSVASTLVGSASLTVANTVGLCRSLSYADGGIYCRQYEDGGCVSDLGDFPAKRSFRLNILWSDDMNIYLLEQADAGHNYIQYKDHLYIDASPGAFAPLSFTADNTTLAEGETTWAWTGALGMPLWTPTGDPGDASPGAEVKGQGFEWVDVEGYPGLRRAYWNQTLFEEMWAGRDDGHMLTMCYGDYKPNIEQGDRP